MIEMNNLLKALSMRPCKNRGKIIDHFDRLPDVILVEIFNGVSEAKQLFNLSMVSKRFASLIPYHSSSTITLQLPPRDSLVSEKIFLRYKFIASFKKFISKFRFIHTLHISLTREFYYVNICVEFVPEKLPQILILSAILPNIIYTKEAYVGNHYYPLFNNIRTTDCLPPLFPGYNACGRWEMPLRMLLSDIKEQPFRNEYVGRLRLPKSGCEMSGVMLSVTRDAWEDDGIFFLKNTRGKDKVLLEAVSEVMNFYQ